MAEKFEPIRHKLSEAVPETPPVPLEAPGPVPEGPAASDVKQHNAEVQPGIKEHMVDIGRGEEIRGRGGDRE